MLVCKHGLQCPAGFSVGGVGQEASLLLTRSTVEGNERRRPHHRRQIGDEKLVLISDFQPQHKNQGALSCVPAGKLCPSGILFTEAVQSLLSHGWRSLMFLASLFSPAVSKSLLCPPPGLYICR